MKEKSNIIEKLKQMKFVQWDRMIRNKLEINVFGWIKRDDKHKDFVVVSYLKTPQEFWFMTSSSKYSETIHDIVFGDMAESIVHYDCERVENVFKGVDNCVKLKK